MIDLRSDTVTKPTPAMLEAMMNAQVGDDVFGEDPTVNALESKVASMFGKQSALFCPSGTMTNQIAIKAHTSPGDEVICDRLSHVYNYEGGGIAFNSGASARLVEGNLGRLTARDVEENINPDNDHYPHTSLVVLENTVNRGGGSYYYLKDILPIAEVCKKHQLKLHLDGARLFNALIETGDKAMDYGKQFDSISVCLSKGLGAPVGSILTGSKEFIAKCRRIRKVFGGAMRQAGFLAAAGIYALDHHVKRLKDDHQRAKVLAETIRELRYVKEVLPVPTNILIFELKEIMPAENFINLLKNKNILAHPIGRQKIRMVTHLDFDDEKLSQVKEILRKL